MYNMYKASVSAGLVLQIMPYHEVAPATTAVYLLERSYA
jgi:hypothetical protein